jgi:hypothetical protein
MGRATLTMTLRYKHLSPAHKLEAVRRLERSRSDGPTGTRTGTEPAEATMDDDDTPGPSGRVVDGRRKWRRAGSNGRPRDCESGDGLESSTLGDTQARNHGGLRRGE